MSVRRVPWACSALIAVVSLLISSTPASLAQSGEHLESSYKIGPNDVLSIFVWKEPELTREVTVMPDGKIGFPLIGEVIAQGRTVIELKESLTEKLKNFVEVPEVTVIVTQSRSRLIYAIGKLNSPGSFPLEAGMTVLQALSKAGGFSEWADTKNVLIIRREGGKETQIKFNYKEYTGGDNLGQNILLKPGDTIVVP